MIFDGHSDIFSDVRYKREAGETQVLKNHHLDRLRKGGNRRCMLRYLGRYLQWSRT